MLGFAHLDDSKSENRNEKNAKGSLVTGHVFCCFASLGSSGTAESTFVIKTCQNTSALGHAVGSVAKRSEKLVCDDAGLVFF